MSILICGSSSSSSSVTSHCVICHVIMEPIKYKCPLCVLPYCSVGCCKSHKLVCSEQLRVQFDSGTENTTVNTASCSSSSSNSFVTLLSSKQIEALKSSNVIRNALKSKRLREHIISIDSLPTSTTNDDVKKRKCLEAMRMKNPFFEEFIDTMLKELTNSAWKHLSH